MVEGLNYFFQKFIFIDGMQAQPYHYQFFGRNNVNILSAISITKKHISGNIGIPAFRTVIFIVTIQPELIAIMFFFIGCADACTLSLTQFTAVFAPRSTCRCNNTINQILQNPLPSHNYKNNQYKF